MIECIIKYLVAINSNQTNHFNVDLLIYLEMVGLRPLTTFTANFARYEYARAFHYFFDLDSFPRLQNSQSYASDETNRFGHTYSKD